MARPSSAAPRVAIERSRRDNPAIRPLSTPVAGAPLESKEMVS